MNKFRVGMIMTCVWAATCIALIFAIFWEVDVFTGFIAATVWAASSVGLAICLNAARERNRGKKDE